VVVDHHELISIHALESLLEYNACRALFRAAGWHNFFAKFQVFDHEVTLNFFKCFDGWVAQIEGLLMEVSEKMSVHATSLRRKGEK